MYFSRYFSQWYFSRTYFPNQPVGSPALLSLLAATVREEIILCELDPVYTLDGFASAGGGLTNTYTVSVPRLVQTDSVKGGLYTTCQRVTQDGVALTFQSSAANVDANAGSWYWNEATGLLYVRASSGVPGSYTMLATRRLYFATVPVVLEQTSGSPNTAVYYHPWITADVPQVRRQVEDILSGITMFPDGQVSFLNGHGAWFTLVAADGNWNWKYTLARFYLGGRYAGISLARSEYAPVATMLVEDVAPSEIDCTFALAPLRKVTELTIPVTPFFEDDYPALGDGVRGTKKWIGYGRAIMRPDLTDTLTSFGVYTVADAAYQTLFAVNTVWAIKKATGVWEPLIATVDFTVDLTGCTVTIINASYPFDDFDIAVDVSGKPDGVGGYLRTYGPILRDLLTTFLGISAADLDSIAFADASVDADADLAVWIKSPRSISSIFASSEPEFPSLGRSVMGSVQQTAAGLWTPRIWDPSLDTIVTTLRKEDFTAFAAKPVLKRIYSSVLVYYGYDHAREQWSFVEVDDPTVRYKTGSRDRLEIYTYLTSENNARTIAQRYMLLAGGVTVEAAFEERGGLLAQMNAGDKVYVTFSPAPTSTGAYVSKPMEVLDLIVRYAPKLTVSGVLGDLRGLGGRVGRWANTGDPDWATASAVERLESGFWANPAGLIDAGDPASLDRSIWW